MGKGGGKHAHEARYHFIHPVGNWLFLWNRRWFNTYFIHRRDRTCDRSASHW